MKFDSALLLSGAILTGFALLAGNGFVFAGIAMMCVAIFAHCYPKLEKIVASWKDAEETVPDAPEADDGDADSAK